MDGVSNSQMQARKIHSAEFWEELGWGKEEDRRNFLIQEGTFNLQGLFEGEKFLKQQGNAEGDRFHKGRFKEGSGEHIRQHQG